MSGINVRQGQFNILQNGACNRLLLPLTFAAFVGRWAAILQTEFFYQSIPYIRTVHFGIVRIQIKDTAREMAPGTAEDIFRKIDVQVLSPWACVTAWAAYIVAASATRRFWNADQRDNIVNMDFDHAASFPGNVLYIPFFCKQLMRVFVPAHSCKYTPRQHEWFRHRRILKPAS